MTRFVLSRSPEVLSIPGRVQTKRRMTWSEVSLPSVGPEGSMVASTLALVLSWGEEHWGLETLTMFSRYIEREGGR